MTTITRQDKNCPAVFYEQDADEFFKEMAEEQVYICPFGIRDRKQLNELLDAWAENGHISRENADKYAASVDDSRFPLTGGFHIPSGHTKGFVMVRTGAISVEDRGWVWHKQQEDARENDVAKKQRDELRDLCVLLFDAVKHGNQVTDLPALWNKAEEVLKRTEQEDKP